jgi:hypothetical protein
MNTDRLLAALSMDLVRISMGYKRGSIRMADRFCQEAKARCIELKGVELQDHIQEIIVDIMIVMDHEDKAIVAEKSMMYSTLLQNHVNRRLTGAKFDGTKVN